MKKIKITQDQYKLILESTSSIKIDSSVKEPLNNFIMSLYLEPGKKDLDVFFLKMGVTYADLISYLKSVGVISQDKSGIRVKNFFGKAFSQEPDLAKQEKLAEIDGISNVLMKDENAPWSKKKEEITEIDNYPAGIENDSQQSFNQKPQRTQERPINQEFTPIAFNYEISLLKGQDGLYVFYYDEIPRDELPNSEFELTIEDIADYVNNNLHTISKGVGIEDYERGVQLVKIDEPLRNDLISIYNKDKKLVSALATLEETTGAASSGSFSPAMGYENTQIEETTASSSGQYSQPSIWAKDKASWGAAKKPQMNGGKILKKGGTDVKMLGTQAVLEAVAKQTNKTVEQVKNILESKLNLS